MKNALLYSLIIVGAMGFAGCANNDTADPTAPRASVDGTDFPVNEEMPGVFTEIAISKPATSDIVDTAIGAGFKTLVTAVQKAELEEALRGDGPFTVFAPTDEAFDKLPEGLVEKLLMPKYQSKLQELLKYHVVEGAVKSTDLRFFQSVPTLQGRDLRILRFFRLVVVNDTYVTKADIGATNGVIHVINDVLVPPGFTLEEPVEPTMDIVDTAVQAGFSTLALAVTKAELIEDLRSEGPLTVFAPTNEAFEALPDGLVEELLLPKNKEKLQSLLLYHVTAGAIRSTDLKRFQKVEMLQGERTRVWKSWNGGVYVNRSMVTQANVIATNGVIHVIHKVLIPRSFYGSMKSLPLEAPAGNLAE